MTLPHHRLSRGTFTALARDEGEAGAIHELIAAEFSKHVILLGGVVTAALRTGHRQHSLARTGFDLLAEALRQNREATEPVIRHPTVGVWARRTILACYGGPRLAGAEPAGLLSVAAVAAIRAGITAEIEIPASDGRAMLHSLGVATVHDQPALVRTIAGQARVASVEIPSDPYRDVPGWRGLRRIRAGSLDITLDDFDPFRAIDLPDLAPSGDIRLWEAVLEDAWLLLADSHPAAAAEIASAIRVIVPRAQPPTGTVSTSSPEAFGTVAMSLPPDPVTCAETLVHEVQHLKLAAVLDLTTLTLPDDGRRYYAPWRDDPRPVSGLLQGAYAYLGVTGFWRRQRARSGWHGRGHAEFARWRAATALAVETLLASGRLTGAGLEFVRGMGQTLKNWQHEPVPSTAADKARRAAETHRTQWESAHGQIPAR